MADSGCPVCAAMRRPDKPEKNEPTGAEHYLVRRLEDPEYRSAYEQARESLKPDE